jgi:hypothetical protein
LEEKTADQQMLKEEVDAWEADRNKKHAKADYPRAKGYRTRCPSSRQRRAFERGANLRQRRNSSDGILCGELEDFGPSGKATMTPEERHGVCSKRRELNQKKLGELNVHSSHNCDSQPLRFHCLLDLERSKIQSLRLRVAERDGIVAQNECSGESHKDR